MEALIQLISSTEFIVLVAAVVAGMIIYTIIKQLFKMAVMVALLAVLYGAFMIYTGQDLPVNGEELSKRITPHNRSVIENVTETIKKQFPEIINGLISGEGEKKAAIPDSIDKSRSQPGQ